MTSVPSSRAQPASQHVTISVVHVVGGIAVGKSSLMQRIDDDPFLFVAALAALPQFAWLRDVDLETFDLVVVPERPERWLDAEDGAPLLDKMYAAPKQYAYRFQCAVLRERWRSMLAAICDTMAQKNRLPLQPTKHLLVVTDGSIDTDHGVFARACFENGVMSSSEWASYDAIYTKLERVWPTRLEGMARGIGLDVSVTVRGTLHLATPVDETQTRIKQRGRDCEQTLPQSYLANIIDRHNYFLASAAFPAQPVVHIRDMPPPERAAKIATPTTAAAAHGIAPLFVTVQ